MLNSSKSNSTVVKANDSFLSLLKWLFKNKTEATSACFSHNVAAHYLYLAAVCDIKFNI